MPFEFVCPFCYAKTKVADEYLGQSGPCAQCGRHVVMPTRDARGALVRAVQTGLAPRKTAAKGDPKQRALTVAIGLSLAATLGAAIVGAVWYALPGIRKGISIAAQRRDIDNMRTIVEALNDYCARYGTYPTPVVTDSGGKPMYSWRVLILPFMGYEDLYKRFQIDQPWDSPANIALVSEMPSVFAKTNTTAFSNHEATYVLLTGPGTIFPPSGPLGNSQVTDTPTMLLVETVEDGTVWTQPGDIDTGKYGIVIRGRPMQSMGGRYQDAFVAVDCDGKGYRIPYDTPKPVIDALVTPKSGEKVDVKGLED